MTVSCNILNCCRRHKHRILNRVHYPLHRRIRCFCTMSHCGYKNSQVLARQAAPHIHSTESIACVTFHSIPALLRINNAMLRYAMTIPKQYTLITSASACLNALRVSVDSSADYIKREQVIDCRVHSYASSSSIN
jgi:hypothetical protein